MTEKIKEALTTKRLWVILAANLIALGLLLFGNMSPEQWINYTITVLRIVLLGV